MTQPAPEFFSRCYRLRSQLVHGLMPQPTLAEVVRSQGELRRFVSDLLTTPLLAVELG